MRRNTGKRGDRTTVKIPFQKEGSLLLWGAFLLSAALFLALTGCGGPSKKDVSDEAERSIFAMDTVMSIHVFGEGKDEAVDASAEAAADAAVEEIQRLEDLLSATQEDSEIGVLNRKKTVKASEDTLTLIRRALEIGRETDARFNIAVYPLIKAWGFPDRDYRIPSGEELDELLPAADLFFIQIDENSGTIVLTDDRTEIDLGGIAKGYTSACLMELFRDKGIEHAIVSLGGNVQVLGTKPDGDPWRIGIEDPLKQGDLLGILETADCAVVTSGGYERYFEEDGKKYHHILNPADGYPADSGLVSATVISPDGTLADALSTALFVMGKESAITFWQKHAGEFDFILLDDEGMLWVSEGLEDIFMTARQEQIVEKMS